MSPPRLRSLICPLAVTLVCVLLNLLPEAWQNALHYQRGAILDGELWRLFTAHLTHLNVPHLLLNLVGFWLIWQLFYNRTPYPTLCLYQLPLLFIGTALGLSLFSPEVTWYRGLSGALHGLLVLALLKQWRAQPRYISVLLALLCKKIGWEQLHGAVPGSEAWIAGRVIVDSHLYGAILGGIIWLYDRLSRRIGHAK